MQVVKPVVDGMAALSTDSYCTAFGGDFNLEFPARFNIPIPDGFEAIPGVFPLGDNTFSLTSLTSDDDVIGSGFPVGAAWGRNPYDVVIYKMLDPAAVPQEVTTNASYGGFDIIFSAYAGQSPSLIGELIVLCEVLKLVKDPKTGETKCDAYPILTYFKAAR